MSSTYVIEEFFYFYNLLANSFYLIALIALSFLIRYLICVTNKKRAMNYSSLLDIKRMCYNNLHILRNSERLNIKYFEQNVNKINVTSANYFDVHLWCFFLNGLINFVQR